VAKVTLHSIDAASRLAALLNAQVVPAILAFRAWRSGRIVDFDATTDFHHGLLDHPERRSRRTIRGADGMIDRPVETN
jgi:hypothetical protein